MKTLENKETNLKIDEEKNAKYSDLIYTVINKPISEPLTVSDIARDVKILNILQKAGDVIEFEDEDFKFVKKSVAESKWGARHNDIVEFAEYIAGL